MTLLYAIGVGALMNVAVAILGRLLRLANIRFDPSGESLVIGIAAAVIVASFGLAARRELVRLALLGLAVHAALLGQSHSRGGVQRPDARRRLDQRVPVHAARAHPPRRWLRARHRGRV